MAIEYTTPVGRIVWGHPMKSRGKTNQQKQPVIGADGQQVQQWAFGIAFDKATFQQQIWPVLEAESRTLYPNGAPNGFAFKYVDGDTNDREGKPYSQREGYAGCYVLSVSTELQAPGVFKFENGVYRQLAANEIKCGDYASVGLGIKANAPQDRTHTPGLYVNPLAVELVGYGQEIVAAGTADPNALFGGRQHQLPPGASMTPIGAPAGAAMMPGMGAAQPGQPGMMQQPMQPQQPMQQPQMMQQPVMQQPMQQPQMMQPAQPQPGFMPPPATDFVANAGQPQQPMMQQPQMMQPQMQQPQMMQPQQPMQQPGMMPGMQPGMVAPR